MWWQDEQERLELSQNLALKEYRFQQSGAAQVGELEKLNVSNKAGKQRLQNLNGQRTELRDQLESIQRQLAGLEKSIIENQRRNATGQKFKVLSSASGREYRDVAVMSVDDSGVAIRHADGSARLRYEDLDQKQREFFGLEESSAMAALEAEGRQAVAYEQWIDSGVTVTREKEARVSEMAKRDEEERAQRSRALVASRQSTVERERPLAQPSRSFGSGYSSYYSNYYSNYRSSRPSSYRYVYYYTPSQSATPYFSNPRSTSLPKAANSWTPYQNPSSPTTTPCTP